ncbi:hypothetical protein X797_007013 [Metarhizium robertsii]|uniref:Proteinrelated to RNA-binding protein cabeza n=2 Tax=Metarhizium robertsii TaxID=568076 RepID=E9F5Y5_METRA|nr:proteinrelated to RNA-binding protein cabeza [Metarhizium robertsii ARSEF 23]EFY96871.1 proteinrelated to RNA-binding protein cabeza [Metarhizium robertsii ARSEF 23]EXU99884.1 hypothetical protein X797_007013 [Metarhizium robertsii]
MVAAPARKTNASKSRSPAKDRRAVSRTQSAEASLVSSSAPSSPAKTETPRTARYSHHLPTDQQRKGNGRVAGRNLIMWNRPRMAEKLLLHIHYECSRHKLQLPWDAIAHRFHPGSSGAAIIQHINRLRREVLVEGHLVPPLTQRSTATPNDPNLRGYVRRDTEGDYVETTRPVYFDERLDDPKFSIPGDFPFNEESMEPEVGLGTSSTGSEEGDYRQDSPTPMTRNSLKSSNGSMEFYETLTPQFVAPIEVVRDTRPPHLQQHVCHEAVEMEPTHSRHFSHESDSGTNPFKGTASPNESFETDISAITPGHVAFPSVPHQHTNHGYRMAALQSWSHPFMYQMSLPPKMHSSAFSFDHQDCLQASFHMGMPFAMTSPYEPYMALDPGLMKQGTAQPVAIAAAAAKEGAMQAEPPTAHGARNGDPCIGVADADETKVADISTPLT